MPFEEGHEFATGRPPGSPNRITAKVKDAYGLLLEGCLPKLKADVDSLDPKDRLSFLLALSEYILPKLSRVDGETKLKKELKIIIVEEDGSGNQSEIMQIASCTDPDNTRSEEV